MAFRRARRMDEEDAERVGMLADEERKAIAAVEKLLAQ